MRADRRLLAGFPDCVPGYVIGLDAGSALPAGTEAAPREPEMALGDVRAALAGAFRQPRGGGAASGGDVQRLGRPRARRAGLCWGR